MKRIVQFLIALCLLPSLLFAATYTVSTSTSTVDGDTFCGGSACTSSDTIIIAAGARGGLLFQDFNGNGSYITIKNELKSPSTAVTITNNYGPGYGVLNLRNCKYVDLRGDNDPSLITTSRSKGIIVNGIAGGGVTGKSGCIWVYGLSDHVKVSYIEANNLNNSTQTGIGVQLQDNALTGDNAFTDMEFSYLWIHDTRAQGGYFGHNDPYAQQPAEYGGATKVHLRRISVHDSIFEDCGNEGFSFKGCDQGPNSFYNNIVIRSGALTQVGDVWAAYLNYGDMTCGLKIPWFTHGAVMNVYDNYFESTAGPSIYALGSYTHANLSAIDGDIGGRIYVYNNIITNAGTDGGAIPFVGGVTRADYQSGILSRYRNYHCEAYDNIIVKPNKYGLAVGMSGDVMTANRNLISEAGTAENYVAAGATYTEGTDTNANLYYADTDSVGFSTWSDDDDYSNDVFVVGEPEEGETTCSACSSATDALVYTTTNVSNYNSNSMLWIAQPFTLAAEKCLTGITYTVGDSAASRSVTCEIYTDNSGSPGVIVGAGFTATIANISDSRTNQEFLFSATQTLAAGNYWIVAKPSGVVYYDMDTYLAERTVGKTSSNSGTSWTSTTNGWLMSVLGCTPTVAKVLTITPASRSIISDSGSTTLDVSNTGTGTMDWTAEVTTGGTWLSITSGASGSNSGTITLAATANTGAERTGVVTVTASGATGSPGTINIVQDAPPVPEPETPLAAPATLEITKGDPTTVTWAAVVGAAGYRVKLYNTASAETENFLMDSDNTTSTESTLYNLTSGTPCFIAVYPYSSTGLVGTAKEITCRTVTTTPSTGNLTIDWAATQAVEDGGNHTMTVTPSANYRLSAYKIGSTWTDWPASNEITFTAIDENKTVLLVPQRLQTLIGLDWY